MEQELFKLRSFQSCMKSAFNTVCSNAKTIIVSTWLPALLNAFVISALVTTRGTDNSAYIIQGIAALALVFTNAFFFAKVANMFNANGFEKNFKRFTLMNLVLGACGIIISLAFFAVLYFTSWDSILAGNGLADSFRPIATVLAILFLAALLPTAYSCMDYIYGSAHSLSDIFGKSYLTGLKSWLFLFNVNGMVYCISLLIFIPIFSLSFIFTIILLANDSAMAMGDTSGLPAYFTPIQFFSIAMSAFIASSIFVWAHVTLYYAYGSLTVRNNITTPVKNEE